MREVAEMITEVAVPNPPKRLRKFDLGTLVKDEVFYSMPFANEHFKWKLIQKFDNMNDDDAVRGKALVVGVGVPNKGHIQWYNLTLEVTKFI